MPRTPDLQNFNEHSSLIQRIKLPRCKQDMPFSFGCGTHGLSDHAAHAISQIIDWDYMGDANFEDGTCAECLAWMWENKNKLVCSESDGYFFLSHEEMQTKVHLRWHRVIQHRNKMYHNPCLDSESIVGWFDFQNGYFVSKTPELRDQLHKFFLEYDDEDAKKVYEAALTKGKASGKRKRRGS